MSSIITRLTAVLVVVGLGLTGVASAKPRHHSYGKTFPVAAGLCKHAAAGKLPKKLKAQAPKVLEACTTLQGAYDDASAKAVTAQQAYKAAAKDARATAKAACTAPGASRADCRTAAKTARATIKTAHADLVTARKAYHASIESARKAFWTSIRALRGGASITPDAPAPTAPVPAT